MSNTKTTTPPMTPPAMAPTLILEAERVSMVLVVLPDDVDAAAAAEDDGAVDSAEDWSDVCVVDTLVVSLGEEEEVGVDEEGDGMG
jgi:hypothetical protein